jgi:hypothetical protein
MRLMIILTAFISCSVSAASTSFWKDVLEQKFSKIDNKPVIITGVITHIKRKYNARDTWYLIDIKDENSERFITVTLYSIKKLRKMNLFKCETGDKLRISGKFNHITSGKLVGTVLIEARDKKMKCYKAKNDD